MDEFVDLKLAVEGLCLIANNSSHPRTCILENVYSSNVMDHPTRYYRNWWLMQERVHWD